MYAEWYATAKQCGKANHAFVTAADVRTQLQQKHDDAG